MFWQMAVWYWIPSLLLAGSVIVFLTYNRQQDLLEKRHGKSAGIVMEGSVSTTCYVMFFCFIVWLLYTLVMFYHALAFWNVL